MENYNNVDIIEQIWEIIEKLRLKLASVINGLGGAPYKNYVSDNVSEINNALDRGMVRRFKLEEHGPERERNPFGYDKSTRSFTICKMPNNPRNQSRTQLALAN